MSKRPSPLPIIVVTGASGFIGRHFIKQFYNNFYIYAIARRTQREVHINEHKNINWIRLDIGDRLKVQRTMEEISARGGADFILHLAGFYDFSNEQNPEYERANINGTRHILENAHKLNIKRFIFTSSLTVTDFHKNGKFINEQSPADATFPYARSKAICEQMIREYSGKFPCAVLRLAAIFSDWCEYGPLYMFLMTWLSGSWRARVLTGRGHSAIPYLHINNLNNFFYTVFRQTERLPRYGIYVASFDGCTTHNELFELANRYNSSKQIIPVYIPKWLAWLGVSGKDAVGRISGRRPFERPWMIKYVDKKLCVDASATRQQLEWFPVQRFHIKRRLLFLIENMKSNPHKWNLRNREALLKSNKLNPNFLILEAMISLEDEIEQAIVHILQMEEYNVSFKTYKQLSKEELYRRIKYIYEILKRTVRSGDRLHSLQYARNLAIDRLKEDFDIEEVILAVNMVGQVVVEKLIKQPQLHNMQQRIHDEIMLTIQLITDEVADVYEQLTGFSSTVPH